MMGLTSWIFLVQYFTSYDQFRYDNECSYENTSGSICHLRIQVTEDYPINSLIYLGIKNYRQSFPRMMTSISDDQLAGKDNASLDSCGQFKTNLEMQTFYSGETESILQSTADSIPCGLMVKNFPRDYFEFEEVHDIKITTDKLSFPGLKGHKYKNLNKKDSWVSLEDEK